LTKIQTRKIRDVSDKKILCWMYKSTFGNKKISRND